jgi:hypothetical protein
VAARPRLSDAERELLDHVRGAHGVCFSLIITADVSEWTVISESHRPDPVHVAKGTGRTFADAWSNLVGGRACKVLP